MKNKVIEFLNKDYLLNIDMIEALTNQGYSVVDCSEEGVVIVDKDNIVAMISARDFNTAKKLIDNISVDFDMIVCHQKSYCDYLKEKFKCKEMIECYQSVYTKKEPYIIPKSSVEIKMLDVNYLEDVFEKYSNNSITDINYIRDRINSNTMLGAFIDDELVGFVGTHEEGSIGILEVIPAYRNRGIASMLQMKATNLALSQGRTPYGQVIFNNIRSLNLQKKLGFEISDKSVIWYSKIE